MQITTRKRKSKLYPIKIPFFSDNPPHLNIKKYD